MPKECVFCSARCESMATYQDAPADAPSYLLAHAGGFRILSDNSPLTPGHVLVVPEEHVTSMAQLSPDRLASASRLVDRLMGAWREEFADPPLLFEHGTGRPPASPAHGASCCLDHAHLHLLPASGRIDNWFDEQGSALLASIGGLADLAAVGSAEYIMVWGAGRLGWVWDGAPLPSQICRKLLGEVLGVTVWHWHDALLLTSVDEQMRVIGANRAAALSALDRLGPG